MKKNVWQFPCCVWTQSSRISRQHSSSFMFDVTFLLEAVGYLSMATLLDALWKNLYNNDKFSLKSLGRTKKGQHVRVHFAFSILSHSFLTFPLYLRRMTNRSKHKTHFLQVFLILFLSWKEYDMVPVLTAENRYTRVYANGVPSCPVLVVIATRCNVAAVLVDEIEVFFLVLFALHVSLWAFSRWFSSSLKETYTSSHVRKSEGDASQLRIHPAIFSTTFPYYQVNYCCLHCGRQIRTFKKS